LVRGPLHAVEKEQETMSIAAINVRNRLPRFDLEHAQRTRRAAWQRRALQAPRVLIIPGLYDSGPAHWQTWLQAQYPDAVRVEQEHWNIADLDRWASRIERTIEAAPPGPWIAVAHSFGCLALARYLHGRDAAVAAALLVAPADPRKFGVVHQLPLQPLGVRSTLIGSESDPWMRLESASAWALLWAARFVNLGAVGHIDTESGFGPFPAAKGLVDQMLGATAVDAAMPPNTSVPVALQRAPEFRFAV
jgi:predicted alpha/beta hydrolase family esterase